MTTKLILVRHGRTAYNNLRRFTGQLDVPLDEAGEAQAERMAAYVLSHYAVDAICSSDLCRAQRTAKPVADALGLPIHPMGELRKRYVGWRQGKLFDEVKQESHLPHDDMGESDEVFSARALSAIEQIVSLHHGKTVLVVTHGGFIRFLRLALEQIPHGQQKEIGTVGNATVSELEYQDGKGRFLSYGVGEHLGETPDSRAPAY